MHNNFEQSTEFPTKKQEIKDSINLILGNSFSYDEQLLQVFLNSIESNKNPALTTEKNTEQENDTYRGEAYPNVQNGDILLPSIIDRIKNPSTISRFKRDQLKNLENSIAFLRKTNQDSHYNLYLIKDGLLNRAFKMYDAFLSDSGSYFEPGFDLENYLNNKDKTIKTYIPPKIYFSESGSNGDYRIIQKGQIILE